MTFRPIELSYSACRTSLCGFRLQREHVRGIDDAEPNDYAAMGIDLHVVAAQIAWRCKANSTISDVGYGMHLTKQLASQPKWDEFQREHVEVTGDRLAHGLSIPRHFDHLIIEGQENPKDYPRLAVNRNYEPVKYAEVTAPVPGHPRARQPVIDIFAGTPDLAWITGQTGGLLDHKLGPGPPQLDYEEAGEDRQLLAYSALLFIHYPDLQHISARKNFWRWVKGEQSPWDWERDRCIEEFRSWIDAEWAQIDRWREEHGDGEWPAVPHASTCEGYCNLTSICPAYTELLFRLQSTESVPKPRRGVTVAVPNRHKIIRRRR